MVKPQIIWGFLFPNTSTRIRSIVITAGQPSRLFPAVFLLAMIEPAFSAAVSALRTPLLEEMFVLTAN